MEIREERRGNLIMVELVGRLDSLTTEDAKKQLLVTVAAAPRLLLDCRQLEYISSVGLGLFMLLLKMKKDAGGSFGLFCLNPRIREIFVVSKLDRVMPIFETREDALENVPGGTTGS
jgi:anti-sigma B factor antagonist